MSEAMEASCSCRGPSGLTGGIRVLAGCALFAVAVAFCSYSPPDQRTEFLARCNADGALQRKELTRGAVESLCAEAWRAAKRGAP